MRHRYAHQYSKPSSFLSRLSSHGSCFQNMLLVMAMVLLPLPGLYPPQVKKFSSGRELDRFPDGRTELLPLRILVAEDNAINMKVRAYVQQ